MRWLARSSVDCVAALGAGLAALVVHGQEIAEFVVNLVAHALAHLLHGIQHDLAGALVDATEFVIGEGASLFEGINGGAKQDLVGVGVADADAGNDAPSG